MDRLSINNFWFVYYGICWSSSYIIFLCVSFFIWWMLVGWLVGWLVVSMNKTDFSYQQKTSFIVYFYILLHNTHVSNCCYGASSSSSLLDCWRQILFYRQRIHISWNMITIARNETLVIKSLMIKYRRRWWWEMGDGDIG